MKNRIKDLFVLYITFCKIGAFMFGGGYSMLPLLTKELVDKKKWTSEEDLLDYFAISQCTPGVIAVNTATFIGNQRQGIIGGVSATLGVVTIPVIIIVLIAAILKNFWSSSYVIHAFNGIRISVAALIFSAVIRLFKASVKNWIGIIIFILSFIIITFLNVSSIWIVLASAAVGLFLGRSRKL